MAERLLMGIMDWCLFVLVVYVLYPVVAIVVWLLLAFLVFRVLIKTLDYFLGSGWQGTISGDLRRIEKRFNSRQSSGQDGEPKPLNRSAKHHKLSLEEQLADYMRGKNRRNRKHGKKPGSLTRVVK